MSLGNPPVAPGSGLTAAQRAAFYPGSTPGTLYLGGSYPAAGGTMNFQAMMPYLLLGGLVLLMMKSGRSR